MPYTPLNSLDTPVEKQGDVDWRGFRSRPAATSLPPGIDRFAQNMRYDRSSKRPRAGSQAMATDLVLVNPPVVLDFVLPVEIAITSLTRAGATVTAQTATAHGFATGNIVGVEGATQPAYNGDWAVTVTDATHFTFNIGAATPATPATGTIVCARGLRVFELYGDRARAAVVYTDDDNTEHLLVACGRTAFSLTEDQASVEIAYPVGELLDSASPVDLQVTQGKVYLMRGRSAGPVLAIAALSRIGSIVTVQTAVAHNLVTGEWVRLPGTAAEDYRGVWQVTVVDATHFTYSIGAATPATPDVSPGTVYRVRPPLQWDRNPAHDFVLVPTGGAPEVAHIRMPPADWMLPYNDQVWLPLARDEIIASDFNAPGVYDTQNAQLRFRPGGNDWLVTAYPGPLTDEPGSIGPRLLVFMRKSMHLVYLSSANLSITAKKQIPGAEGIGCRARRTVQTCGDFVAWLSDQGVQLAQLGRELALLTARLPLSTNIQDLINRINWPFADNAVAAFHDNRYHLAVPLDDSEVNNAVLVFNFLNAGEDSPYGEWESLDVYPGDFDIVALPILAFRGRQRLHALSSSGYAYALDIGDQDQYGSPGGTLGLYDIPGIAQGRRLLFGSLETKKFLAVRVDLDLEAGARTIVQFTTSNPDSTITLEDHQATRTEDKTIARRPRARGISGAVDLLLPRGRPTVKAITVDAASGSADTKNKE